MLTKEQKNRWVAALRSGKYEQCQRSRGNLIMNWGFKGAKPHLQKKIYLIAALLLVALVGPASSQQIFSPAATVSPSIVDFDTSVFDDGGLIELPDGIIEVERSFKPRATMRLVGKGVGRTKIRLKADLEGPLFEIAGDTKGGKLNVLLNVEMRDLTIETDRPERRAADAVRLKYVAEGRFDRVKILGFAGYGLHTVSMWDFVFTDVQIARCGDIEAKKEALHLADQERLDIPMGGGLPAWLTNNNNHFFGCRFENGPYILTYMGIAATKNQFVGCKWHGELVGTRTNPSKSGPYSHIVLAGYGNTITGSNIVRSGANGIDIFSSANGTIISGNTIGTCDGYGIQISKAAKEPQIIGNSYPHGWEAKNQLGDMKIVN